LSDAPLEDATIRVVIAEDQSLVLGALAALLELERDIHVVGQASSGEEALRAVEEHRPNVLVTDIEMPGMTGIELAQAVRQAGLGVRVVIVTSFARPGYLRRALDAGVTGYLLKDAPAAELADAVRRVNAGLRVIAPQLAVESWTERDPLTERERVALRLAGDGLSAQAIADQLGLSEGTVRNYLSEAIGKLGASNRVEAARIAREKGLL
jgi:two-component system response regulator DesR